MSKINLSEVPLYQKFQLALVAGYKVIKNDNRYKIDGADDYIDNDFRNIDDILQLISGELQRKGIMLCR